MGKYKGVLGNDYQSTAKRSSLMYDQNYYTDNRIRWRKVNFYNNYIYIHLHQNNIGLINRRKTAFTDVKLAKEFLKFKNYKDGKMSALETTLRTQYGELLKNSMNLTSQQSEFLDEVLDPNNKDGSKILDDLNKALQEGFEAQFTTDKIASLLRKENEKKSVWSENSDDYKKLNSLLKNNGAEGFSVLNDILERMVETVEMLQSSEGKTLGKLLSNVINEGALTYNELGANLKTAIDDFINDTDISTISGRDAIQVANNFRIVAAGLEKGTNSKGEKIGVGSVKGLVQNNFYSLTAEVFASHLSKAAINAPIRYIIEAVQDIDLVGDSPIDLEVTSPEGKYGSSDGERTFFRRGNGNVDSGYGKTDLRFNNVEVNMALMGKEDLGNFTMKVGLSNKAYATNKIGASSLAEFKNQHFSLGGGMTLGNAFKLLGCDLWQKYLGYNILAKGAKPTTFSSNYGTTTNPGLPMALNALQDALLTRSLLYLVAGRSKEDFANFMFVNGRLLSVWDIVKYAINNNIGKSQSQQKSGQTGVYMSIPSREIFQYYGNVPLLGIRVPETNKAIDRAVMKGNILPGVIAQYIDTSKINKS